MREKVAIVLAVLGSSAVFVSAISSVRVEKRFIVGGAGLILLFMAHFLTNKK